MGSKRKRFPAVIDVWLDIEGGGRYRVTAWGRRGADGFPDPSSAHWDVGDEPKSIDDAVRQAYTYCRRLRRRGVMALTRRQTIVVTTGRREYDAGRAIKAGSAEVPERTPRVFRVARR